MSDMADRFWGEPDGTFRDRALRQAGRSLLLAQSSDWPFIMKCGTNVAYANKRIRDHLARFHHLVDAVVHNRMDEQKLRALEAMDNLFPFLDFRVFRGQESGGDLASAKSA
jgi:1,4-alpha-glucan branching enzyme